LQQLRQLQFVREAEVQSALPEEVQHLLPEEVQQQQLRFSVRGSRSEALRLPEVTSAFVLCTGTGPRRRPIADAHDRSPDFRFALELS
jgi:hypothetical protein